MRNGDGKPTVLVVEDDRELSASLSAVLEFEGYRPVVADTGGDALLRLTDDNFDAALIEIRLPDISGLALSNLIRTQFGPELGIVVMSDQTIDGLQDRPLDAGADDFMRRPFAPQTLIDRLSQLIDGH